MLESVSFLPLSSSNVVLDITGFVWASIMTKKTLNGGREGDNLYMPLDGGLWPRNYKTCESVSTVLCKVVCDVCFFKSL